MLMSKGSRPAKLHYMANGFRILVHGDHVLCAETGNPIALDVLRYWCVARQEAYSTPDIATRAATGQ
jgi:hypothetical protein